MNADQRPEIHAVRITFMSARRIGLELRLNLAPQIHNLPAHPADGAVAQRVRRLFGGLCPHQAVLAVDVAGLQRGDDLGLSWKRPEALRKARGARDLGGPWAGQEGKKLHTEVD